jgi:sigma-B regulation protein RsbU (phosphoserine phosphatase)
MNQPINSSSKDERCERLKQLLQINVLINSSLDIDTVLAKILESATEVMQAGASSIMLLDESSGDLLCQQATGEVGQKVCKEYRIPKGKGIAGWVAENGKPVNIPDVYKDERFSPEMDRKTGFRTQSLLCIPLIAQDRLVGVAQVINRKSTQDDREAVVPFDREDEELFDLFGKQAAIAIDNARLHQSAIKQKQLEWDLRVAHEIQKSLLPQHPPRIPGLEIGSYYKSSFQVGGDAYDFFPIGHNQLALVIADVSGKGISAALYNVRFISDLRSLALQTNNPAEVVNTLNRMQCERSRFGMFITLIFGVLDLSTYWLNYVQAGHPALCRLRPSGQGEFLKAEPGPPIGVFEHTEYHISRASLAPGEALLWYTDGVIEVRNSQDEMIGQDWMCQYQSETGQPVGGLVQRLIDEVHRFGGQQSYYDDIAMFAVKRSMERD